MERLQAVKEALAILKKAGYTLNNDAYSALYKEKTLLEQLEY